MLRIRKEQFFGDLESAEHKVDLSMHEERLAEMAVKARKKGIPLLMCTLPVNEKDFSPYGSLPEYNRNFNKAVSDLSGGRLSAALKGLNKALAADSKDPFVNYYLARTYEKTGDFENAKKYYRLSVEYDKGTERCSSGRNEMIRKVAAGKGACLADLEKSFSRVSSHGIIGGDHILDGVHWPSALNPFVWAELWSAIAGCPPAGKIFFQDKNHAAEIFSAAADKEAKAFDSRPDRAGEIKHVFLYVVFYVAQDPKNLGERLLGLLSLIDGEDRALLLKMLGSKDYLRREIPHNMWAEGLLEKIDLWRPALLNAAAEMWRRKGKLSLAGRFADEALKLEPANPRFRMTKARIAYDKGARRQAEAGGQKLKCGARGLC